MATHRGGPERPAGLRDVARMAGVSVATASLALTGQPGVADSTRRRIVAVAEQLGYHANPQAQALRRGRTTTYGFVVRNFANPFFLEVLSGAQQVAAESGDGRRVPASRGSARTTRPRSGWRCTGWPSSVIPASGSCRRRAASWRTRTGCAISGCWPVQLDLRPRVMYSLLTMADVQLAAGGLSVIGHDDLPTSELLAPPLATIRIDHRAMGRALMRRLLEPGPPDDYIADVELVERASLRPPALARSGRAHLRR